jgi:hypothetical protein
MPEQGILAVELLQLSIDDGCNVDESKEKYYKTKT